MTSCSTETTPIIVISRMDVLTTTDEERCTRLILPCGGIPIRVSPYLSAMRLRLRVGGISRSPNRAQKTDAAQIAVRETRDPVQSSA